jgi:hypothetical protein
VQVCSAPSPPFHLIQELKLIKTQEAPQYTDLCLSLAWVYNAPPPPFHLIQELD